MNRDNVVQMFKFIKSVYPFFEVTTEKVDHWAYIMRKMDFERVMNKLEQHALENKFAPSIAEITAYPPEKNNHLEEMESWKKEAAKVPESKKQEFREQMQNLIKAKTNEY